MTKWKLFNAMVNQTPITIGQHSGWVMGIALEDGSGKNFSVILRDTGVKGDTMNLRTYNGVCINVFKGIALQLRQDTRKRTILVWDNWTGRYVLRCHNASDSFSPANTRATPEKYSISY